MNKGLEIITITKIDLKKALDENTYWSSSQSIVPFSKSKAQWLLENDRLKDEDLCALLVYENGELVVFILMVADWISTNDSVKKIFWSTRWWVANKYENTILATYCFNEALNKVDKKLLIRYLGSNAEKFYEKQPFTKFSKRARCIIIFNLDYNLLTRKIKILKRLTTVLKSIDRFSHYIISIINKKRNNKYIKPLTYEYLTVIDDDTWSFVKEFCKNDIIPKTKEYINWQTNNNQYTTCEDAKSLPYKCLLSSISEKAYNVNILVKKNNINIGFISALVRGNGFVVRYFLADKANFNDCADVLMASFIDSKCTSIQTENGILGNLIQQKYINVYSDKKDLFSLVHNTINLNTESVKVQDQDGSFF